VSQSIVFPYEEVLVNLHFLASMMFIRLSAVLAAALSVLASPLVTRQATGDNGACQQLHNTCAGALVLNTTSLANVWSIESCLFAATCLGPSGSHPVDNFLADLWTHVGGNGTAPASANLPRVPTSLLQSLSTDGSTISQQDFINGFYGSLNPTNGPWPVNTAVISYYDRISTWTAFCTSSIPFFNFADYFQWSASVSSPGCSPSK